MASPAARGRRRRRTRSTADQTGFVRIARARRPTGTAAPAGVVPPSTPGAAVQSVTFWALNTDGTYNVALPDVASWQLSPVDGSPGAVTLDYPADGVNFDVLRESVTADRDLEIAIWVDGRDTGSLRALLNTAEGDDVAESAVWRFSGNFLNVRMEEAVVAPRTVVVTPPTGPAPTEDLAAFRIYAATAGQIMATLLQEAQGRAALHNITRSFTNTLDSHGTPWSKTVTLKIAPGTTYLTVLQALTEALMCEWEVVWNGTGRELVLWEHGTRGTDHTLTDPPLILRAGDTLTESPRKHTVRDAGTTLLAAGAEGLYEEQSDATALVRRGRRIEKYISQGSLTSAGSLAAYTAAKLPIITAGAMELGHGIALVPDGTRPLIDYQVGDWVWSDTGHGLERLRLRQLTVTGDAHGILTAGISLNDLIADQIEQLSRRISGIEGGTTITGTSNPQPVDPDAVDTMPPAAPAGVVVDSLAQPSAEAMPRAAVFAEWAPVTTNQDTTAIDDLAGYVVQFRYLSPSLTNNWVQPVPQVNTEEANWGDVIAGEAIEVRVAAVDTSSNQSAWSASAFHTTETDATAPPTPSTPVVVEFLGTLTVSWNGLGSAGEAMPGDFAGVEIHRSTASGFTPSSSTLQEVMLGQGARNYPDLPIGTTQYFRLVAYDKTTPVPNKSAPSAQASGVPQLVSDGDIAALSVGKLTAGTITAVILMAGLLRSATSGLRYELDSAGLRFYDASNNLKIHLDTATASALLTGTVQTGITGRRAVLSGADNDLKFYPQVGETRYARLYSYVRADYPDDIAVELRAIDSTLATSIARLWLIADAISLVVSPIGTGGDDHASSYMTLGDHQFFLGINQIIGTAPFTSESRAAITGSTTGLILETHTSGVRDGGFLWLGRQTGSIILGRKTSTADNYVAIEGTGTGEKIRFATQASTRAEVSQNGMFATRYHGYGTNNHANLKVNGSGTSNCSFRDDGSANLILDSSTKSPVYVKNFVIEHPLDPDRFLVHGCTESPAAGVEYSGTVTVTEWCAEVQLPGYFEALTDLEGRQVFLQVMLPDEGFHRYIPRAIPSYPVNGKFRISTDADDGTRISWLVKAIRKDVPQFDVEPLKSQTTVRGDDPYRYVVPEPSR